MNFDYTETSRLLKVLVTMETKVVSFKNVWLEQSFSMGLIQSLSHLIHRKSFSPVTLNSKK